MSGADHIPSGPGIGPVAVHYIKSTDFRVIHVDGAIGSITPRGLIHAGLFSERMPIPQLQVHNIEQDGSLSPPTGQETKPGIVREVEVGLLLDRAAAESLRIWLGQQIADLDHAVALSKAKKEAGGHS
jgi:hypothetical protein